MRVPQLIIEDPTEKTMQHDVETELLFLCRDYLPKSSYVFPVHFSLSQGFG